MHVRPQHELLSCKIVEPPYEPGISMSGAAGAYDRIYIVLAIISFSVLKILEFQLNYSP